MNTKTLSALEASIAKWEANATAETPDDYKIGAKDCPLCDLFINDDCAYCPVFELTGRLGCAGTPHEAAANSRRDWKLNSLKAKAKKHAHQAARDEAAFLISLHPNPGVMMKWVTVDDKPAPEKGGWYRVMIRGDSETDGAHVFYDYPDYETWAQWIPAEPEEAEESEGLYKGAWHGSHDEGDADIFAYAGPVVMPKPYSKQEGF